MSKKRQVGVWYRRRKRKGRVESVRCASVSEALEHTFYDEEYLLAEPLDIKVDGKRILSKRGK